MSNAIEKLTDQEFAEAWKVLHDKIMIDPLKNFVEAPMLINFTPSGAQRVAFKCVFGQELDAVTKYLVYQEDLDEFGDFALTNEFMTETEIYELMTGFLYEGVEKAKTKINLIVGRRGGKCQDWDSFITLADGSRHTAGSLVGKDFEVLAYDEKTGLKVKSQARGIDNGVKGVYRIRTRTGFVLDRTANHPLMTPTGFKSIDDGLAIGDSLQIPRINDQFSEEEILDDEELMFLAYIIGDGCVTNGNCGYTQIPNSNSEEFEQIIENYYGGSVRRSKSPHSKAETFFPRKALLSRQLLKDHGVWGKGSATKSVPDVVFRSSKRQIALFLNRLFSTDGSIYMDGARTRFEYCSISEKLATEIKHLLQRFGIVTSLREKAVPYTYKGVFSIRKAFVIAVSDYASVETLITEIGIKGKDHKFQAVAGMKQTTNHPNSLMPKEFWKPVIAAQIQKGFTDDQVVYGPQHVANRSEFGRLRKQYRPNRYKLLSYFNHLEIIGPEKTIVENYWFDDIESIEYLGERKTAGIEVDTYHTYINDVVEHNTTLASIIALYSAIKINWKPFLTKTPEATVMVLSHSVEFSEEVLSIIRQLAEESPILNRLINLQKKNTQRIFNLKVPFILPNDKIQYSPVRVKVGAASKKTTRGSAVCTLLCDEIAFWNLAETAAESDVDVLRAVRPALLQFGAHATTIKLSSPGIKQGVLYSEWIRKDDLKDEFVQFKAPSWVWNTFLPRDEFKKELLQDPEGFDTELRANFVDSISNFISPEFVDMCIMKGVQFQGPSDDRKTTYSAAIDAAFKGDRFAFAVVGYNEKRVTTYIVKYWEGSKKKPVQISEVATYIRTVVREYNLNEVVGDQFAFQPMRELFLQYGINLVENTFTLPYKKKIYFGLKRLIHNRQIDLLDIPLLATEIKQLQVEQTPTGQIKIGHPAGGTDDCVPADTLIKTQFGQKPISDIKVGDLVYTHLGRLKPVVQTFVREYDTDLYTINPFGQAKLKLTGNHPLFASVGVYGSSDKIESRRFDWKLPKDWKKAYKVSGRNLFEMSRMETSIEDPTSRAGNIDVTTSDFGLLLGYFIGDGWAIRREKSVKNAMYKCSLAFNKNDTHMIYKFSKLLAKYKIKSRYTEKNGGASLTFHSKLLWNVFVDCYDENRAKKLPTIFYTHKINQHKLLQGWLLADGTKVKKYRKPHGGEGSARHWVGCTTSKRLALELNDLAWGLNIFSSFSERTTKRYGKPTKDQYWLAFRKCRTTAYLTKRNDYRISSSRITKSAYKGLLYNLHVEEDESYIANGIVVHNCSDALAVAAYKALEKAGVVQVTGGEIAMINSHGVRVDHLGRTFTAPPVELLTAYAGFQGVIDNSAEYVRHPDTGKIVHISELEEDTPGGTDSGSFSF